jgi:hypothetical protein
MRPANDRWRHFSNIQISSTLYASSMSGSCSGPSTEETLRTCVIPSCTNTSELYSAYCSQDHASLDINHKLAASVGLSCCHGYFGPPYPPYLFYIDIEDWDNYEETSSSSTTTSLKLTTNGSTLSSSWQTFSHDRVGAVSSTAKKKKRAHQTTVDSYFSRKI